MLAGVLLAVGFVSIAPASTAQTCDPAYGCNPEEPPPPPPVTCSLNLTSAAAGQIITASVADAPAGASVQITVDGNTRATGTADANGDASIGFTLPTGGTPTSHAVFAVGATFSASCGTVSDAGVQGVTETRTPSTPGSSGSTGVGAGSLARTGLEIGLLLAIAIVLILVGQRFVAAARRRRRRRARERNRPASLADRLSEGAPS